MALEPPDFATSGTVDAAAEYARFVSLRPVPAAHLFAELVQLQAFGSAGMIPPGDVAATSARDLYCRRAGGWAVFYTADLPPLPFRVKVLHAAPLRSGPFGALEGEAVRRMRLAA